MILKLLFLAIKKLHNVEFNHSNKLNYNMKENKGDGQNKFTRFKGLIITCQTFHLMQPSDMTKGNVSFVPNFMTFDSKAETLHLKQQMSASWWR